MTRFGLVVALTLVCSLHARAEGLARLDFLIGEWNGTSRGEPGEGKTHRVCAKVLNDRYIECRNTTTYEPSSPNGWTERFELAQPGKDFSPYSSATLQRR